MLRRIWIPLGIVLMTPALVLQGEPARSKPKPRPQYKDPLDVMVDEEGKIARVVLPLAKKVAVVDLVKGRVTKELPLNKWVPLPIPVHGLPGGQQVFGHSPEQREEYFFLLNLAQYHVPEISL